MANRKCCVGGCDSTSKTHRLFNLPKDDSLRALWLSFLIPTNVELSGLSKEQLVNKRVCHSHFDRYQFDGMGNRLKNGYPCLFSPKEIYHGIPLPSCAGDHLSDHNYFLQSALGDGGECVLDVTADVVEAGDHLSDHNYFLQTALGDDDECVLDVTADVVEGDHSYGVPLHSQIPTSSSIVPDVINQPAMEFNIMSAVGDTVPSKNVSSSDFTSKHRRKTLYAKKQKAIDVKLGQAQKLRQKCACFIKELKQKAVTINSTKIAFSERLTQAEDLNRDPAFFNNFSKMPKQAQDFLMLQLKSVNKKKKAMRFSNDEKLLSLALMKESPKGYRLLQKIFRLPTKRTLNRMAEKITFRVGINDNIFRLIRKKVMKWDSKKKMCSIIFDEVALTPHLTYVEAKDEIRGFKDLGYEKQLAYCDHALVFMIRGICSNWKQPVCYYFCEGTTSAPEVKRILKDVVAKTSETGLIPLALVCDQGATFRSAIKMFKQETDQKRLQHGEHNDGTIEISGKSLSVVYDPPHLLKSIRNNFVTKNIIYNGNLAQWDDIVTVYGLDCQLGIERMNDNLKDHHVIPNKIKKMKVSVAAQVFSHLTGAMLKYTACFKTTVEGEKISDTMRTTGEIVQFFDKLFDSVNGSKAGNKKGKLRGPITPKSKHFSFWKTAKKTLKSIKFIDSKSKRALYKKCQLHIRVPCLDGWLITLESIQRIAKLLFEKYNLEYLYPRHINQDPLENFFGRIRALNYRNVNPDSNTFINSFKSLLISNIMGPHSIYSNCEEDDGQTVIDFLNLLQENKNQIFDEDKENMPPAPSTSSNIYIKKVLLPTAPAVGSNKDNFAASAILERVRVQSSAYTAGYLCRRLTKKFNCRQCKNTYIAEKQDNIHEWIAHREYKNLKNSNLAYPSKVFLLMYRNITTYIHDYLNKYAHKRNIGKCMEKGVLKTFNLQWLGCTTHKIKVHNFYVKLILRMHIHNWCNIINKILKGNVQERYVNKNSLPQVLAYNKYKTHRLKQKKK